jgi:transglutaminase-like putative cysteine protease
VSATYDLPGVGPVRRARLLAVASVALIVAAYLQVLSFIVTVTGDPETLTLLVVGSLLAGVVLARLLRPWVALLLGTGALAAGTFAYITTLPEGIEVYGTLGPLVADSVTLLSGLSILRIVNADVWALSVAPAPTFLAAYLTVRRNYVAAATVAGATLGVFVLTGDAETTITLLGAVGVIGAMGFGDLDATGPSAGDGGDASTAGGADQAGSAASDADDGAVDPGRRGVLERLAAVVVVALSLPVVPSQAGGGGGLAGLTGGGDSLEANLVRTGDQLQVLGSIELSPEVRFAVEADRAGYWRVSAYDRYTGEGWVRTGGTKPYEGNLETPPGEYRDVEQTYEFEGEFDGMPAQWRPTVVEQSDTKVDVLQGGSIRPVRPFSSGESYTVTSAIPVATPRQLRGAGTDYPDFVAERYTALPENTPGRVAQRTSRITANADNPYDIARVVERWLQNNRGYSLDVDRPDGTIADAFLFEMREGYCTYFATTMVTMLRTQDIPARFAVGYTEGERVGENRWIARGLNAHAWVEVFFTRHGWIRFDPTPGGPREEARRSRVSEARESNESNVDTTETGPETWTPTPDTSVDGTPEDPARTQTPPEIGNFGTPAGGGTASPDERLDPGTGGEGDDGGIGLPDLPSREQVGLGLVVALGAAAGLDRAGVTDRAYREIWLRYQPRRDPVSDVRRAYERAEYVFAQRERPRRTGETVRQYAAAVGDDRLRRLAADYERATYGGSVDAAAADEAVALADEVIRERGVVPVPGR